VIDALDAGLRAVASRSPFGCPLVFAAGVVTSLGPCAAPRYVAVAALAHTTPRPGRPIALFIAGLVGAYVCLGSVAGALGAVRGWSAYVYAALAVALALGGATTLLRHDTVSHAHTQPRTGTSSAGGAFLLGASSALVVSPCCTPIVAGIAGLTIASGRVSDGVMLLASFGLGHAAPLLGAAFVSGRVSAVLRRLAASPAPAVVAGTLMLGLAAYFGALA